MNIEILDNAVQAYINLNLNNDVNKIALSKSPFKNISAAELANQIVAKKKAERKLPSWYHTEKIYYPSSLSIEQTSSEITAKYKSRLAKGNSLIDLTAGFGVDAYYFSKYVSEITHCEINEGLSSIAKHNAVQLQIKNIIFKAVDGLEYLENSKNIFDTAYIDPARRAEKGKVFLLKDCTPDVVSNLDKILTKTNRLLIKTAPLLDIAAGLAELRYVSEIHIVSVKNECKELVWVIDKAVSGAAKIIAVTLNDTEKKFNFSLAEMNVEALYAEHINGGEYLHEPDVALLKSGAFNLIGSKYGLKKLHQQTQLYVSSKIESTFPGRIFKIISIIKGNELKKIKNLCGNVIVRNYPAKAEDLVKKFKIKSEKNEFLIFTRNVQNELIVISAQIIQYY
ncbi:class I SAM-dependent methyltransferase [Pedobacter sp. Leaf132]|uniref:class I SAM-dependent methyltransferase n=1 Tax=Pedobacter sp. Leaf132 TaxID=2876557 RepID=UPI001E473349|nr:class I SAM-dependent methyltransferase [Pedobacter sp. Leaf132]